MWKVKALNHCKIKFYTSLYLRSIAVSTQFVLFLNDDGDDYIADIIRILLLFVEKKKKKLKMRWRIDG